MKPISSYSLFQPRQANQSQFIDEETRFAFSNASSVLIQIDFRQNRLLWKRIGEPPEIQI